MQTTAHPDQMATRRANADGAVWWHAAWLIIVASAVFAHYWWRGGVDYLALAGMIVPGVLGLVLSGRRQAWASPVLILVWAAASGFAAFRTGGITGPLAVLVLTPLAAALLSPSRRDLSLGASVSAVIAISLGLLQLSGQTPATVTGVDGTLLGLFAIGSLGLFLGAAAILFSARTRRLSIAALGDLHRRAATYERLSDLIGAQPQLLLVLDAAGKVSHVAGATLTALDGDSLIHGGLLSSVADDDRSRVDLALAQAILEGSSLVAFAPANATDRWLEATFSRSVNGEIIGAIADRTQQHDHESQLEQARAESDNLNAGKSRFLANMSHELRTPLNAIIGFSDVMRTGMFGTLSPKYEEYAGMIHESGGHLLDLINDVLDMSKIEAERFELAREEFDAREAVSAALRLMRLQADEAGVQLRGVLANGPLDVYADRRALKQIVLNLVSNALKFTGRSGQVTVTARAQGETLEISVADTGLGISSEDLARLGRPFEQAGGLQQRARGTGLGLSLVRAFAELHGGVMAIESTLGEGTAVTVRLPVLLKPSVVEPSPPPEPQVPPPHATPAYTDNVVAFDPRR